MSAGELLLIISLSTFMLGIGLMVAFSFLYQARKKDR